MASSARSGQAALPPSPNGEGQTAKRSGWGSQGQCSTPQDQTPGSTWRSALSPTIPTRSLRDLPEGEGGLSAAPPSPNGEGQTAEPSGWGSPGKRAGAGKQWEKSRETTRRARELRKNLTPQEARLWLRLRALRPEGFHFRRQTPLLGFYLDFVCFKFRLVIEVDGDQHGDSLQADHDAMRDSILRRAGFQTLRFSNADINTNIDGVMDAVLAALASNSPTLAAGAACPSPEGEGGWSPAAEIRR